MVRISLILLSNLLISQTKLKEDFLIIELFGFPKKNKIKETYTSIFVHIKSHPDK